MESKLSSKLPLFRRMRRNVHRYESFPDISSIDELQRIPGIINSDSLHNKTPSRSRSLQMKSSRCKHQSEGSFKARNETDRLRDENEKLKQRLNAANNAIRDLENVCRKNSEKVGNSKEDSSKIFCSFLPKKAKAKGAPNIIDDRSLFSTASTVRMGSKTKKKSRRDLRKKSDENILLHHQEKRWKTPRSSSCPQSMIPFGNKHHGGIPPNDSDTAPCTPERSPKVSDQGNCSVSRNDISSLRQRNDQSKLSMNDNLEIRANENLNVEVFHCPVKQGSHKMNFLAQVAMKTVPLSRMAAGLDRVYSSNNRNTELFKEQFAGQFPRVQSLNEGFCLWEDNHIENGEDSSASDGGFEERVEI